MICDLNVGCVKNNATLPNCVAPEWIGSSLYCKDGGCRNGKIGSKCEDDCSPYCALDQNGACTDTADGFDFAFCKNGCSALAVPEKKAYSDDILCRSIDSDNGSTSTVFVVIGAVAGGAILCFMVSSVALLFHRQREMARFSRAQQQTYVITSLQQPNQQVYVSPKQGGFPEPTDVAFSQPAQPAQVYQPQAPFVSQSQAKRDHQPSAPTDVSDAI